MAVEGVSAEQEAAIEMRLYLRLADELSFPGPLSKLDMISMLRERAARIRSVLECCKVGSEFGGEF